MDRKRCKAVYIIGIAAALASAWIPGGGNEAHAQLTLPGPVRDLTRLPDVDRRLERTVDDAEKTADDVVDEAEEAVDETAETVEETTETLDDAADELTAAGDGLLRDFVGGVDPNGWDVEDEIIVVLVDSSQANTLLQPGTEIVSRRELPALRRTLFVLRRTVNTPMTEAIRMLRDANPGATVDFNHLYRVNGDRPAGEDVAETAEAAAAPLFDDGSPRVGIVDSAIMRDHRAFAGVRVAERDFAAHEGIRPRTHGTAVASLVAASGENRVTILAASVFFQLPNHGPGATAESIVAALDWLVGEEVDVINMSLAGPANTLVEAAIAALDEEGVAVVAAVGNNGPSGEPLYPAAYDGVIGVTAVDSDNRIFRYANRGAHVGYAAKGVYVKVADSTTGGWRIESGTSMASPHVAVVAAQILTATPEDLPTLMSLLTASAEDLGRKGFDEVFGHGLITQPPVVASAN